MSRADPHLRVGKDLGIVRHNPIALCGRRSTRSDLGELALLPLASRSALLECD
jgi:hypothetical protein